MNLDGGSPQAPVVGIERDRGKLAELRIPLELAAPGIDARGDLGFGLGCDLGFALFFISISISALVCGAIGSAHGALEEHLGLFLRPLPIQIMI